MALKTYAVAQAPGQAVAIQEYDTDTLEGKQIDLNIRLKELLMLYAEYTALLGRVERYAYRQCLDLQDKGGLVYLYASLHTEPYPGTDP